MRDRVATDPVTITGSNRRLDEHVIGHTARAEVALWLKGTVVTRHKLILSWVRLFLVECYLAHS